MYILTLLGPAYFLYQDKKTEGMDFTTPTPPAPGPYKARFDRFFPPFKLWISVSVVALGTSFGILSADIQNTL